MDSLSTATEVNEWTGRGLGLLTMRKETQALEGAITTET